MSRIRRAARSMAISATMAAVVMSIAACNRDETKRKQPVATAERDTSTRSDTQTSEAAGEVAIDSVAVPTTRERWISDANIISLMSAMNGRQIAAADIELSSWHSDTVRAFAASMAREHADLQRGVDSIAARLNLTPVSPALSKRWAATMQAQIDSMLQSRGDAIDRAFVRQQVNGHSLMRDYVIQLAAAAEQPQLRTFLETAAARVAAQMERARALQTTLATADSAAAARRATTRKRASTTP